MGRRSITQSDSYAMTVLPCDVDDSGMMTNERYGRHGAFALRKFWIRNGVEKLLSSRGGGLSLEVVSRQTTVLRRATSAATGGGAASRGLGLFGGATIKTSVAFIDDALESIFIEQKFTIGEGEGGGGGGRRRGGGVAGGSGRDRLNAAVAAAAAANKDGAASSSPSVVAVSLVQVRAVRPVVRVRALPRAVDERSLRAVLTHALSARKSGKGGRKGKLTEKQAELNRQAATDVAVLSDPRSLQQQNQNQNQQKQPSSRQQLPKMMLHFIQGCAAAAGVASSSGYTKFSNGEDDDDDESEEDEDQGEKQQPEQQQKLRRRGKNKGTAGAAPEEESASSVGGQEGGDRQEADAIIQAVMKAMKDVRNDARSEVSKNM